jgi:hypothetical protein
MGGAAAASRRAQIARGFESHLSQFLKTSGTFP